MGLHEYRMQQGPGFGVPAWLAVRRPSARLTSRRLFVCWLAMGLLALGCGRQTELDTRYGRRRATPGSQSVNGTSVLAKMFENAGHDVSTWRRLSPKLDKDDVLIWFPDSFELPSEEETRYLESWLSSKPQRLLVYVGRDFDAAIGYWSHVADHAEDAPSEQRLEMQRRLAQARSQFESRRTAVGAGKQSWFSADDSRRRKVVRSLAGPWSRDVDSKNIELELRRRLEARPGEDLQVKALLQSEDDVLVAEIQRDYWLESRVIVIANGSFLLNSQLVNHEHRKLAARLIEACGPAPRRVTFLESDEAGLSIVGDDETGPTGFEAFQVWPLGAILLHITMVGILYCCMVLPIDGRPRQWKPVDPSDFGKHVRALGELFSYAADRDYAKQRILQYHEIVHARSQARAAKLRTPFRQ